VLAKRANSEMWGRLQYAGVWGWTAKLSDTLVNAIYTAASQTPAWLLHLASGLQICS
jgi:hypothetical protein